MSAPKTRQAVTVLMVALCLVRVWLTLALPLRAMGRAALDDRLFVRMATSLLEGHWLGGYDHQILTVGPFYPLWVALSFYAGVPLILGQQLLYVFACVMLFVALREFVPSARARLLVFSALLFAPFTFDYEATRVVRDNLYMSLSLLVLAGFLGLLGSAGLTPRRRARWALGSGVALSAFWLTREEGLWLAPTLAVLLGYSLLKSWPNSGGRRVAGLSVHLVPVALCAVSVFAVALTNYARYDVFHVIELRDPAFEAANGALLRVRHKEWNRFAQVPQETRLRIYAVSPTFSVLEPYLEGIYGRAWGKIAESSLTEGAANPVDIRGSWFMWGLRRGASDLGYHRTAAQARAFYQQMADEINAACSDGRLECGPERASMLLPWRAEYAPLLARSAAKAAWRLTTLDALRYPVDRIDPYKDIDDLDWEAFQDITRSRLLRTDATAAGLDHQNKLNDARLEAMRVIRDVYPYLMAPLCLAGGAAFFVSLGVEIRRRHLSACTVISGALLLGIAARIGILSYLAVTSFDALEPRYLLPLYPMAMLVSSLSLWRGYELFAHRADATAQEPGIPNAPAVGQE
jgi:hypothetical protein